MPKIKSAKFLTALFALTVFTSCASSGLLNPPARTFTLVQAESLKLGEFTREVVLQKLGAPDLKPKIEGFESKEIWLYLTEDRQATRISLFFDVKTGKLDRINWFVDSHEPEADLDYLRKRYASHRFVKRSAKWTTPHSAPDELFFVDKRSGLKIVYAQAPKQVEAIIWTNPADRSIAAK